MASDGNFYGTATQGGSFGYGTVFRVTPGGKVTNIVNFNSKNGAYPQGSLIQATDGNFYGTTYSGGSSNDGTVFKLTPNGTLTTLVNFSGTNGSNPSAALLQANDGNFYGVTYFGGNTTPYTYGLIFKITPSGVLSTLASFNGANGSEPNAPLIQGQDGCLYGTTENGSSTAYGTAFKVTLDGTLTSLANFEGNSSAGLIQASDGNFYGTTYQSGTPQVSPGYGTIFQLTANGTFTTLVSFTNSNGASPSAALIQGKDGYLYGTTGYGGPESYGSGGGTGNGTIFRASLTGTLNTIVYFNSSNGANPIGGLIQDSDGTLYGTTYNGISSTGGATIFKTTTSGVLTTMANFTINGTNPYSNLIQGKDGNFYGTTSHGGPVSYEGGNTGYGTVFEFSTSGVFTTLANFNFPSGTNLYGGLVEDNAGNFYGTTSIGGPHGDGTVFQLSPNGSLTTLANFNYSINGANPYAGLAWGNDGNLYGTTYIGGSSSDGTIFKVTTGGTLTTLVNFNETNGANPYCTLTSDGVGNFYGTTSNGGTSSGGTVFQITSGGTLTTLANFANTSTTSGYNPRSGILLANNGNLYGTTQYGGITESGGSPGAVGDGTIFQITPGPEPVTATLVNFTGFNGNKPYAGLTLGSDGNFYGTTEAGGSFSDGTIFQLTPAGTLNTLVNFNGVNGLNPFYGALVEGSDGNFYGTTSGGGLAGSGTVFRLNPGNMENIAFNSSSTIPIITTSYIIIGSAIHLTLNYAPAVGDVLTLVHNTGNTPISGAFTNLPNGGTITATYQGHTYTFRANYFGGSGNDLTLIQTRTFAQWESDHNFTGALSATPENDGVPNLLKYLFSIAPSTPMSANDRAAQPVTFIDTTTNPGTEYLTLKYRYNTASIGVSASLQTSSDLQTWSTVTSPDIFQQVGTDTTTGDPIMEIGVILPPNTSGEFLRLKVVAP